MFKKIFFFCLLFSIASCKKDNPVSPAGENTQMNGNKWVTIANMNKARGFFCSAKVGGKIYLFGGFNPGSNITDAVEEFDLQTDKSILKNNMPEKICGMAAAEVDGKIYTFGGRRGNVYSGTTLNYTYLYDTATDSWTRKKDMPSSRAYLTASVVDGKIYTIGGCEDGEGYASTSEVQMYDPASDIWTNKTNIPKRTAFHTASVFDGKIYVIGGGSSNNNGTGTSSSRVDVYDPVNDSWTSKADISPSRWCHGSGIINNKLYICGGISSYVQDGVDHYTLLNDLLEYDFSTDTWVARASMPSHRRAFQTCIYNNKFYIFEGLAGEPVGGLNQGLNNILAYIPNTYQ